MDRLVWWALFPRDLRSGIGFFCGGGDARGVVSFCRSAGFPRGWKEVPGLFPIFLLLAVFVPCPVVLAPDCGWECGVVREKSADAHAAVSRRRVGGWVVAEGPVRVTSWRQAITGARDPSRGTFTGARGAPVADRAQGRTVVSGTLRWRAAGTRPAGTIAFPLHQEVRGTVQAFRQGLIVLLFRGANSRILCRYGNRIDC